MKNQNYVTVYLAGACFNEPDEGRGWRQDALNAFRKIDKYDELKSCVIDPTAYFSYSNPIHKTDKQVKAFYMSKIKGCDVILCNLNGSMFSVGTGQEIQFAVCNNIPVIGFGKEDVYPWLKNVDCDVVFDTLEEAVSYIKNYYMVSGQPVKTIM